ncbi:hypothetical protein TKK_0003663 [Trichogramma kaykai]
MSSSNGVSDERSQSGGDAVNKHVEHPKLKTLKMYRKAITWKLESQRHLFLHAFGEIIRDWKEPLPNLRDFLTKEEMDWLLVASIKPESSNREIVDFVARSGYKDEPDLDEDGKPVLRCTTAVHKIAERHQGASGIDLLRKLFRIYDKFRLNYTDESGYTHFYMACKYNLDDVAEKFLELGQIDPNFLVPETGDSLLYFLTVKNSLYPTRAIIRMLLKHGADPNRTSEDGSTPLQGICQMRDRHYVATKRLLESCDELQRTVTIDAQDKWGDTPLLWALKRSDDTRTVRELLRRGADPNLANEVGYASLHFICLHDYSRVELLREFFKLTDEFGTQVRLDARDYKGNTPLHIVLKEDRSHLLHLGLWSPRNDSMDTVEELLKRGADPNTYDAKGRTPLHVICRKYENRDLLKLFFDVNDEFEKTLRLDIRDKEGNTPLHLATLCGSNDMIESLLRRGADPDVANAEGLTPLHVICQSQKKHRLFKPFFKVVDSMERTVLPDVRDNEGNTPLHLVTARGEAKMIESLLGRGADPCLANADGLTPLLMTASTDARGSIMQLFLGTRGGGQPERWAGIDARDPVLGRTELEWVVTRCWPLAVRGLLDRGADVAGFVFPSPSDSDRYGDVNSGLFDSDDRDYDRYLTKPIAATGLLAIVELLQSRGYAMNRDDALKFMGFFDKYGFCGCRNLSTDKVAHDLVDSIFDDMVKKATYIEYFKFSYDMRKLPRKYKEVVCSGCLCEKVSRKFFRDWALDPFMQLIHYRLPTECCEIIIEKLSNKDLYNICLAGHRQELSIAIS